MKGLWVCESRNVEFWPSGLYTVMAAVWPLAPGGGRKVHGERNLRAEAPVGSGRHPVVRAEVLVEHRQRLESGRKGDVGQGGVAAHEQARCRVDLGAEEQVGGRGVIVLPEQLEAAGRAESRSSDDGSRVPEPPGIRAHLGYERLNGL